MTSHRPKQRLCLKCAPARRRAPALARLLAVTAIGLCLAGCKSPVEIELEAAADSKLVGLPAPEFSLEDQDGNMVSLADLRGHWVVLYFYSDADTPACECDATEFTKVLVELEAVKRPLWGWGSSFQNLVYGIGGFSVDNNKYFIEKWELGVDLLSDMDHQIGYRYGACASPDPNGDQPVPTCSATVIVDPEGVIRYHWPVVVPEGHVERVHQKVLEFQAGEGQPARPHTSGPAAYE